MKVTRYFVGFGPTLWSFRRGETEYGLKAIPLGGFVQDRRDDAAGRRRRAGRRAAGDVALPGVEAHDRDVGRLGHPLRARPSSPLWCAAVFVGLPNPALPQTDAEQRAAAGGRSRSPTACSRARPSRSARPARPATRSARRPRPGLQTGDRIIAVDGTADHHLRRHAHRRDPRPPAGPGDVRRTTATAQRRHAPRSTWSPPQRPPLDDPDGAGRPQVAVVGVGLEHRRCPALVTYGPVDGVRRDRRLHRRPGRAAPSRRCKRIPEKVPGAVDGDHRRRARPGHPDQRGRRQPARRRGGRARRCPSSSC